VKVRGLFLPPSSNGLEDITFRVWVSVKIGRQVTVSILPHLILYPVETGPPAVFRTFSLPVLFWTSAGETIFCRITFLSPRSGMTLMAGCFDPRTPPLKGFQEFLERESLYTLVPLAVFTRVPD